MHTTAGARSPTSRRRRNSEDRAARRYARAGDNPLHGLDRLPMAGDAQGISALLDGARLFLRLVAWRPVGRHQPHAGQNDARQGRAPGQPDGRQPVGKDHRERRPSGFDAGKKIKGRKRRIVTVGSARVRLLRLCARWAEARNRLEHALGGTVPIERRYPRTRRAFALSWKTEIERQEARVRPC